MSWQVRMQADDFFNAYQVLKKNYHSETLSIMGPSIVCLAFALEIYIKDVYYALNIKVPRKHSILDLYTRLPKQYKREIFFHDSISQNPFALREPAIWPRRFSGVLADYCGFLRQIRAVSKGFEDWRYPYEVKSASLQYNSWFAEALIVAVKSVADSVRERSAA